MFKCLNGQLNYEVTILSPSHHTVCPPALLDHLMNDKNPIQHFVILMARNSDEDSLSLHTRT